MAHRLARFAPLAAGLSLSLAGYWLSDHVLPRVANHRGYHLVAHEDRVTVALGARPRRTLVAVIDGLRQDAARRMASIARVRAAGRCAVTYVGLPSVSRPVYTEISSGVEQERSGVRYNDDTAPAAVDSVWERARDGGLRVEARSELTWWRELFPRGFDAYTVGSERTDLFAAPLGADVTLIHPVYVDETSHDHGVHSREYARDIARVDRELGRALDGVDFRQDTVLVTADHGHRDAGGHGGPAPVVTEVLTCFGGRGVRVDATEVHGDARDLAPTLAVLLGVSVPRNAGATRDPTGMLRAVVDRDAVGAAYFDARVAGVAAIEAHVPTALRGLSGGEDGTWASLRRAERRAQWLRALCVAAVGALAIALFVRRFIAQGERLAAFAWSACVGGAYLAAYRLLAGGLDASTQNGRGYFIRNIVAASATALALGVLAHVARGGSKAALRGRASVLLALVVVAHGAHLAAFGWPLGFPLPGPYLYFAPFLLGVFQVALGALVAALTDFRGRE